MRTLMSALSANVKHKVDFSLVPIAIIIIEFSVLITQLTTEHHGQLNKIISVRISHTLIMLLISWLVSWNFIRLKKDEVTYQTLAITGVLVLILADILHGLLASMLGLELISSYRRLGIVLIQGLIWFPAFMIIVGNRKEIINGFKEYEQRLIVAARARTRVSNDFLADQTELQKNIRKTLYRLCSELKDSITSILNSRASLNEEYAAVRAPLTGENLRTFSRALESGEPRGNRKNEIQRYGKNAYLWIQQFRILYQITIRSAPMRQSSYGLVLIALVTPAYIYFYSFQEFLLAYPILVISLLLVTRVINMVLSKDSNNSSMVLLLLIFITGELPYLISLIERSTFGNAQPYFPPLVAAVFLPLAYVLFMVALQVLRPRALSLIRNNDLIASEKLQDHISRIVSKEFSDNLSHQWAIFIHGKILTRLAATSLKLENIAQAGKVEEFSETAQSLLNLLGAPDSEFEESSTDLYTEVISRLNPWRGLLEINLEIDPELRSIRDPRVRDLGQVVEELISNSIRHGKSKNIELKVQALGTGDVQIIAIDDAVLPPAAKGEKAGLGTRIFNLASDGRWSLSREGSRTVFTLTMGLER